MSEKTVENKAERCLEALFDEGRYTALDAPGKGARIAYGSVQGSTVFAYAEGDNGGVFDGACAAALARVYDLAEKTGSPVVAVFDSCGVPLDGGAGILGACSELLGRFSRISGVVPQIAAVNGTCGGFAALAASMADVCVMSESAELFLTAPFLDGKNGNGTPEFALNSGAASLVCPADELFEKVRALVGMLPLNNMDVSPVWEAEDPAFDPEDPVASLADADSLIELNASGKESAARTWLATVGGTAAGIVRVQGEPGARDSARMAKLYGFCDAFSLPVVTLLDSEGFKKCSFNDLHGGIRNAARLAGVYASSTNPKLTVVTGNAIGTLAAMLCGRGAGNDLTLAWPGAVLSPLTPEAAAAVLKDDEIGKEADLRRLAAEYAANEASAPAALRAGLADRIVTAEETRAAVAEALGMLASKRVAGPSRKHNNLPY